jgi:hypothetical protein
MFKTPFHSKPFTGVEHELLLGISLKACQNWAAGCDEEV